MKAVSRARGLVGSLLVATCLSAALVPAALASERHGLLSQATDLGPVDTAAPIELTLWMKLHDEQGLDALVAAQQAGKGAYLSAQQLRAQHGPSSADAARVASFLQAEGFTTSVGQDNLYVRASSTVARVQSARSEEH